MKKEYFKPEIRFVAMNKSPFMAGSTLTTGGYPEGGGGGGAGTGQSYGEDDKDNPLLGGGSRFWEDFDEDLLEDIEDINDLD